MQRTQLSDGRFLSLVLWDGYIWIVIWEEKAGEVPILRAKEPANDYFGLLDHEELKALDGLPLNTIYDDVYKHAFQLY